MRKREAASGLTEESGARRASIIGWMLAIVVSFALGAFVTHFALLRVPISQFSFQDFFMSPFWSTASIALVCFVLGIGFAYVPFAWYRDDANRKLRTEHRDLRVKADALRNRTDTTRDRADARRVSQPIRAAQPDEPSREPPYAGADEGPQDIAAVISEMSAAIKANLREAGSPHPAGPDIRQSPLSKPFDE